MQGADEYYDLFNGTSQQIGRLVCQVYKHARGKCFEILLLPADVDVDPEQITVKNAVKVYGILSGQPGWTETYGWIHKGKWQEDFDKIIERKKIENKEAEQKHAEELEHKKAEEDSRINKLLSSYT